MNIINAFKINTFILGVDIIGTGVKNDFSGSNSENDWLKTVGGGS
jgi:hypothetical protein